MVKIIHQTWKDRQPPSELFPTEWAESWRLHNPGWDYRLWVDEEICDFVHDEFPEFFAVWCAYPKNIMRVDAWRYLLLQRFGGLYADLDVAALRPLEPWIGGFPQFACADQGDGHLCNAFMWAPNPHEPFLDRIVKAMTVAAYHRDPLDATGPRFLERFGSSRRSHLSQIPTQDIFPIGVWDRQPLPEARTSSLPLLADRYPASVAISFWTGSWLNQPSTVAVRAKSSAPTNPIGTDNIYFAVFSDSEDVALLTAHHEFYAGFEGVEVNYWMAKEAVLQNGTRCCQRVSAPANIGTLLEHFLESGKEWAFICSESTYFVPERLGKLSGDLSQLICNEALLVQGELKRDAGYLIERTLAQVALRGGDIRSDRDLARYLTTHTPATQITPLLRHERDRYPNQENRIISSSFKDWRYFSVIPPLLDAHRITSIACAHQFWRGELQFVDSGGCVRPETGCCGFWTELQNGHRLIEWFEWPPEVMIAIAPDKGFVVLWEHASELLASE